MLNSKQKELEMIVNSANAAAEDNATTFQQRVLNDINSLSRNQLMQLQQTIEEVCGGGNLSVTRF